MCDNNLLKALNEYEAGCDAEKANKIRSKVFERALQNVNLHLNQEVFRKDLKQFLDNISDDVILAGVNVYFGRPRQGAQVVAECPYEDYTFTMEQSDETSRNAWTLKVCYAYKRAVPSDTYLINRLKGFFDKVLWIGVSDDALKSISHHLNEDYTMEVWVVPFQNFRKLAVEGNEMELISLDGENQNRNHICQALLVPGQMWIFGSELRPRDYPLTFRLRKAAE